MGILNRFKDIMASNINALLDKCEDPEKMIDQYLRNAEKRSWKRKGRDSIRHGRGNQGKTCAG